MLSLSYVGLPIGEHEIPGLGICGETEDEVLRIAELARDHFEQPGLKASIMCAFQSNHDGTTDFLLDFPGIGSTSIKGVQRSLAEKIRKGLSHFAYYFIILAYRVEGGSYQPINPKTFHLVKADVLIDKATVLGRNAIKVNWATIFDEFTE